MSVPHGEVNRGILMVGKSHSPRGRSHEPKTTGVLVARIEDCPNQVQQVQNNHRNSNQPVGQDDGASRL